MVTAKAKNQHAVDVKAPSAKSIISVNKIINRVLWGLNCGG